MLDRAGALSRTKSNRPCQDKTRALAKCLRDRCLTEHCHLKMPSPFKHQGAPSQAVAKRNILQLRLVRGVLWHLAGRPPRASLPPCLASKTCVWKVEEVCTGQIGVWSVGWGVRAESHFDLLKDASGPKITADSKQLEYGHGTVYLGFLSSLELGLEDSHIPTFWLLL